MKPSLKTLLILAGAVLATSVAQANPYVLIPADTMVDTLTGGHGANPSTFTVTSTVSYNGADYQYDYIASAGAPKVQIFSVFQIGAGAAISNPAGFTGAYDGASTVNWVTASSTTLIKLGGLDFDLISPLPPTVGSAGAQDGSTWGDGNSIGVNVPGAVPDGGLTVTLLGGALLGLGAIRRKLGC